MPTGLTFVAPALAPIAVAQAAPPAAKEGWYKNIADTEFVLENAQIPPKKGVVVIDSRPAARRYDIGHIPGAINIPDSQFDKLTDRLPADKNTLLLMYCGGQCSGGAALHHAPIIRHRRSGASRFRATAHDRAFSRSGRRGRACLPRRFAS